jgi:hypothetical protein
MRRTGVTNSRIYFKEGEMENIEYHKRGDRIPEKHGEAKGYTGKSRKQPTAPTLFPEV